MRHITRFQLEKVRSLQKKYGEEFGQTIFGELFARDEFFLEKRHLERAKESAGSIYVTGQVIEIALKMFKKDKCTKHHQDTKLTTKKNRKKSRKEKHALYLQNINWRFRIIQKYNYTCQRCFQVFPQTKLDVHHVTYERFAVEKLTDLLPLCRPCHQKEHGITKVSEPIRNYDVMSAVRESIENGETVPRRFMGL